MQRRFRLTGSKRFSTIRHEGQSWANRFLVLKLISNDLPQNRIGFAVGKRIGVAVARNKVKRRLKEIVRLTQLNPGWDILFIARKQAPGIQYQELKLATEDLLRRSRLLLPADDPSSASVKEAELGRSRNPGRVRAGATNDPAVSSYHGGIRE